MGQHSVNIIKEQHNALYSNGTSKCLYSYGASECVYSNEQLSGNILIE